MLHTVHPQQAAATPAFLHASQATADLADSEHTPEAGPIHEGGWTATQSLEFFRAHGIRGRLLSVRGRQGRELREYVCRTRYLDGSVDEFAHRILATPACHTV